jgi:3-oxoadipate CoA-transferase, beta subunit
MAARLAHDLRDGWYVNLGIGLPTLVAEHVPSGVEVVLHSENGMLGVGPAPPWGQTDDDLINAGKQPVTALPGAAYFHQADSFAMIRGGHLDLCVIGAFEVSVDGDLSNWSRPGSSVPAVGGAMDLVVATPRVWVLMSHTAPDGSPKLVTRCNYPITGSSVVNRIYTELATLETSFKRDSFLVLDVVPGVAWADLETRTGAPLCDRRANGDGNIGG